MQDVKTSPPRTAGAIIATLRAEALSMRKPEGDVVAELADELAATLHANSSIALPHKSSSESKGFGPAAAVLMACRTRVTHHPVRLS